MTIESHTPLCIHLPWGWLWLNADPIQKGWSWAPLTWAPEASERHTPHSTDEERLVIAFEAYAQGDDSLLMAWPLPRNVGTPFQQAVWQELIAIPTGTTATYGEVAQRVSRKTGKRPAPQAVGQACKNNPWPLRVPCHRVISTAEQRGQTGFVGYAGQTEGYLPTIKTHLLDWEKQQTRHIVRSQIPLPTR